MSASGIFAAAAAVDRERNALNVAWGALSELAAGDVIDRLHHEVVDPYLGDLRRWANEISELATRARAIEQELRS